MSKRSTRTVAFAALVLTATGCGTKQAPSAGPAQPASTTVAEPAAPAQPPVTPAPGVAQPGAPQPSAATGSTAPQPMTAGSSAAAPAQPDQEAAFRFASGRVVRIEGHTLQVGDAAQTVVSWTDQTSFTELVAAAASDLAVGRCVQVRPMRGGGADDQQATSIAAESVTISEPVDGACRRGGDALPPAPAAPAAVPGQSNAQPPPPPFGGGFGGFGGGLRGLVTAISGDSITVELHRCAPGCADSAQQPTTRTFTVSTGTTWHRLARVGADAVAVGQCATVVGRSSADPTLTAVSISLRPAVGDRCFGGMGGFGSRRWSGPGNAPGMPGGGPGPGGGAVGPPLAGRPGAAAIED